jgi:hypothetical protein
MYKVSIINRSCKFKLSARGGKIQPDSRNPFGSESDLTWSDPRLNDLQSNRNLSKIWKNTTCKLIRLGPTKFLPKKLNRPDPSEPNPNPNPNRPTCLPHLVTIIITDKRYTDQWSMITKSRIITSYPQPAG